MGVGILLDLLLLGTVLLFAWRSARRGFVRTVLELAGWAAVFYLSVHLSPALASGIYKLFFFPSLENRVAQSVEASISASAAETTQALWDRLPGFLTNAAGLGGVSQSSLSDTVSGALSQGSGILADQTMTRVVEPVMLSLIRWVLVVLLFTLGMFLVRLAARLVNRLFSFRTIGTFNRFLGGLLGALKGALIGVVFCLLLAVVSAATNPSGFFAADFLPTSYLYQFVTGFFL